MGKKGWDRYSGLFYGLLARIKGGTGGVNYGIEEVIVLDIDFNGE
ncbi:hypothetical protein SDC9_148884 [bioreactor metagenome]|uniref:Uncharacterized protein n=1 Tax=bioreactor metagenome TaxID=1076179 RepID=A0A645EMC0_9ZZZZ